MPRRPSPGNVTDRYGWRIHPISKQPQFHQGLDIGWVGGRTLVAPENGVVVGHGPQGGWGNRLDFQGDSGALHYLAHTERSLVPVGSRVTEGSAIAVMGDTGRAAGIHVHWEVRPDGGDTIDPESWLAQPAGGGGTPLPEQEDIMASIDDLRQVLRQQPGPARFFRHTDHELWVWVMENGDYFRIRDLATARLYKERNGGHQAHVLSGDAIRQLVADLEIAGGRDLAAEA